MDAWALLFELLNFGRHTKNFSSKSSLWRKIAYSHSFNFYWKHFLKKPLYETTYPVGQES